MLSYITKFFGAILVAIIANRIMSLAIALIIGFIAYLAFANPKVLSEIITRIKEIFGFIG